MKKKGNVIGAGVAGLASAIRLQHAGYQVELFEKESMAGGKMHRIQQDGYQFDLGPTIVMMPDLYKEIFYLCGKDPDDYIPMERLDPMYSVYFGDKPQDHYEISAELSKLMEVFEGISEDDAAGFLE